MDPVTPAAPVPVGGHRVAVAREHFLGDQPVPPGTVRQPILASWARARQFRLPADHLELSFESDSYRESPLLRIAGPIIEQVADQLATEPVSVILCDDEGVVLERRTGDRGLEQHLNRVWLAPGFSYAERYVGTNGIGTALESRGPAHVFGHEHYVQHLEDLACAGTPIRNPITGRLVGVLDLTCWRPDAGPLLISTASLIAGRIQDGLLQAAGRHEISLLHDYLTACQRSRGAVLAIGKDLLMMNDRARELLDPSDQGALVAAATEALGTGRRSQLVLDLPSGATARIQCRPAWPDGGEGGSRGEPGGRGPPARDPAGRPAVGPRARRPGGADRGPARRGHRHAARRGRSGGHRRGRSSGPPAAAPRPVPGTGGPGAGAAARRPVPGAAEPALGRAAAAGGRRQRGAGGARGHAG
jgi:hypothetical protein